MKQFIVNRHTTPATPTLEEVPNEKIRVFANETAIDAALSSLDEDEIVATEDGAESSTRIGNPLGTILAIHSNAVPYGYLPCNGVAFDEHQYPALYALLGDNHTPYSYDKSRIGDFQTLSSGSSYSDTMEYDGSLYIKQETGARLSVSITRNGSTITLNNAILQGGGSNGLEVDVKKGDVVSITGLGNNSYVYGAFFTHFNVIKATSGLEETQQDYVLQSLLEADNYSTTEVATGKKWIDGKTIYRRTFYSATNWANGTTIGTISNLSMVIKIRDITCATNNLYYENLGIVGSDSQKTNVRATDGAVIVDRTGIFSNSKPSTVIVEYTKN